VVRLTRWSAVTLAASSLALPARAAASVCIGVLTEMGGPYAEDSGPGSVAAARLAIDDFQQADGNKIHGMHRYRVKRPASSHEF